MARMIGLCYKIRHKRTTETSEGQKTRSFFGTVLVRWPLTYLVDTLLSLRTYWITWSISWSLN